MQPREQQVPRLVISFDATETHASEVYLSTNSWAHRTAGRRRSIKHLRRSGMNLRDLRKDRRV
ncbi:MAG: hypothetical protein IH939_09315 [Acidobacteria bacterium]|nr:hypothetical protein [Acidobacteriota bacterium]